MRVFVAVPIPKELQERIAAVQDRLKQTVVDVRWVERDKFHLTLKFLGEVPDNAPEELAGAISGALAGTAPFAVSLCGLGAFPDTRRPRVVWAGIREGKEELRRLAGRVDEALAARGFAKETRPFSCHLTLGRVRSPRNLPALVKKIESFAAADMGRFEVAAVDLMQSVLHSSGSRYTCLRSVSLLPSAVTK